MFGGRGLGGGEAEGEIEGDGGLGWFGLVWGVEGEGAVTSQPSGIGSKVLSVDVSGTPAGCANGTRERYSDDDGTEARDIPGRLRRRGGLL